MADYSRDYEVERRIAQENRHRLDFLRNETIELFRYIHEKAGFDTTEIALYENYFHRIIMLEHGYVSDRDELPSLSRVFARELQSAREASQTDRPIAGDERPHDDESYPDRRPERVRNPHTAMNLVNYDGSVAISWQQPVNTQGARIPMRHIGYKLGNTEFTGANITDLFDEVPAVGEPLTYKSPDLLLFPREGVNLDYVSCHSPGDGKSSVDILQAGTADSCYILAVASISFSSRQIEAVKL